MNKKGISHIEYILAFVLFTTFLIFTFIFLNPFQSNRTLDTSLDYANIEIRDFVKVPFVAYSVVIDPSVSSGTVAIDISDFPPGSNASVIDSAGQIIPSYTNNGVVHFQKPADNFVRIRYSPDFSQGSVINGVLLTSLDYNISSSETKDIISENKFLELNSSYYSDYEGLKNNFNLPNRIDFGFSLIFNNGDEIIAERSIPENLEVIAEDDRIEILRINENIEFADLVVRIW